MRYFVGLDVIVGIGVVLSVGLSVGINVGIYAKTVVVGAPGMDNGNDIDEGAVYAFTLSSGET